MSRRNFGLALAIVACQAASLAAVEAVRSSAPRGQYLEARTCQIYTGPCFANAEASLTGKEAMLAWNIEEGAHRGVDLSGRKVVLVVCGDETLGFKGLRDARRLRSVVLVDDRASTEQADALVDFVRSQAGLSAESIARVDKTPITLSLDTSTLDGKLEAGKLAKLTTRKARPGDCICTNETAYYPPLVKLEHFAPGVAIDGEFNGKGLASTWSIPGSRSVYMATFAE